MSLPFLPALRPSGCGDPGAEIAHACLFDGGQYLTATTAAQADRKLWTLSIWCERTKLGAVQSIFGTSTGIGYDMHDLRFDASDRLTFSLAIGDMASAIATTAVFRDPGAWLHIVAVFDSANAVGADRMRLYVNRERQAVTSIGSAAYPFAQNTQGHVGNANPLRIGMTQYIGGNYLAAYLAEGNFIWGQGLEPSEFGYTNRHGVWVPRRYTGTYGAIGRRLAFADPVALGADSSGNALPFSVSGLTAANQVTDTPTHGFATLNPLNKAAALTLSNGNLDHVAGNNSYAPSTVATLLLPSTGKWWWASTTTGTDYPLLGVAKSGVVMGASSGWPSGTPGVWAVRPGVVAYTNGTTVASPFSQAAGDEFHMAYDADAGNLAFFKNGAPTGFQFTGLPAGLVVFTGGVIAKGRLNFGQMPTVHTPPSGYKTLSTPNLPCPAIKTPPKYFARRLASGGAGVADLPWSPLSVKTLVLSRRYDTGSPWRINASILPGQPLTTVGTAVPAAEDGLTFTATGYTIGAAAAYAGSRVDYIWRASAAAGFDLLLVDHVSGVPTTVPHAVGGIVDCAMVFPLAGGNQRGYHRSLGAGQYIVLNTDAVATDAGWWASSAVDLTLGGSLPTGQYLVAAWREVPGFSAFGRWIGNASADGAFAPMDFAPALVLERSLSTSHGLWAFDSARASGNPVDNRLPLNATDVPATGHALDFLSNGIKARSASAYVNGSGAAHIYAAWAETPTKFARAR